ncbi:MAG: 23S rRNA (uracil(1939)-C(5))-methyltransferase RlmD, partial [Chloroflexota bacterium]|nr:23S rRNA (uracil(1939)-C(5))-methyltransferase RlmD [Chloroflexota bacterium]
GRGRGRNPGVSTLGPVIGSWVERLGGRNFWVGPEAFFQVHTAAAENLLMEVRDNVPSGLGLILDAHAGVGTFALSLADRAKRVIAFEMDRASVDSARWTARAGSIANVDFRVGKAEMLIGRMAEGESPDLVLLDPPRSGCHHTLLRRIEEMKVPRVVYVSCDPSTLARDIKMLSGSYKLTSARMIDMFPQTYHLETVAVLDLVADLQS